MIVGIVVFSLFGIYLILGFLEIKRRNKAKKQIIEAENSLRRDGFIISRQAGNYNFWGGGTGASCYHLYVDDVNKKWLLTSYYSSKIGKIRRFDDLLGYNSFDRDTGVDIERGLVNVMATTYGAAGGAVLGGLFGGGVIGGLLGGAGGYKAVENTYKGKTSSYGLRVKTKDCDELICDFCNIIRRSHFEKKGKKYDTLEKIGGKIFGLSRSSGKFKRDNAVIKEMESIFASILSSNRL